MTEFAIKFDDLLPASHPHTRRQRFRVFVDAEPFFVVDVFASQANTVVLGDPADDDVARRTDLLLRRWGLPRIEEGLITGELLPEEPTLSVVNLEMTEDDVRSAIAADKDCRYSHKEGSDTYCAAASATDSTAVGVLGVRRLAPTSRAVCSGCNMPDKRVLCSHFVHPEVFGFPPPDYSRQLVDALCECGSPEIGTPLGCWAGQNGCWERTLSTTPAIISGFDANALPMALDHFNAIWRVAFGKPVLQLRSVGDVAGLIGPSETRAEFEQRVVDLADVFASLAIPKSEVPAGTNDGALNHLEAMLKSKLQDADAQGRVEQAVDTLRQVATIRNGFGHSAVATKLPGAFARLSVPYPPPTWAAGWQLITARVVDAVATLRYEVNGLT